MPDQRIYKNIINYIRLLQILRAMSTCYELCFFQKHKCLEVNVNKTRSHQSTTNPNENEQIKMNQSKMVGIKNRSCSLKYAPF